MNQSSFEGHYLKKKSVFIENYCMEEYGFCMTVTGNETSTRKTLF